MKIFGYNLLTDEDFRLRVADRTKVLEKDLSLQESLVSEQARLIKTLRGQVDAEKLLGLIKIDIGDPTPEKAEERRAYIARVAGFYKDILQPKCLQMISVFHKLLEEETNDKKTDTILKIGVYVCREWMKWGEQAISEQVGNQVEPPPTPEERKEEIITQIKL